MDTGSLFGLVTARSVRILPECFLVLGNMLTARLKRNSLRHGHCFCQLLTQIIVTNEKFPGRGGGVRGGQWEVGVRGVIHYTKNNRSINVTGI